MFMFGYALIMEWCLVLSGILVDFLPYSYELVDNVHD